MSEENKVKAKVINAYKKLLENDIALLKSDVNERSITCKLAEYLKQEFIEYDVDCEYNRNMLVSKTLEIKNNRTNKLEIKNVYPDIIVHKRETKKNYIVIEAKKIGVDKGKINKDIQKLKEYKKQLSYEYAIFITFYTGQEIDKCNSDVQLEYKNNIHFIE